MNSIYIKIISLLLLISIMISPNSASAKIVEYNFDVDYKTVNFSGKDVSAMSVGGTIPAPTIEATVGDTLRVTFNNKMDVETSIHWHGILLPNDQDGVPYLNTPPIKPRKSFTFEFPVIHHGTYWYHSHTGLQEQRGVYGSIVFHTKKGERVKTKNDIVLVLSDWTDENPNQIMHNLKKSDDYYSLKKDSVQSWYKVINNGKKAIKNRLNGAWIRMGPMDISDVAYDAFLMNGEEKYIIPKHLNGNKVRLRIINAAASSYFYLQYASGPMTIVAVDGVDVKPLTVDRQRIAVAETYDVIVDVPKHGSYEFRATSEDSSGYSSAILGHGHLTKAPDIPKPNLFLIDHSTHSSMNHDKKMGSMNIYHSMHKSMKHNGKMGDMSMEHSEHETMGYQAMMKKDHGSVKHSPKKHKTMTASPKRMKEYELLRSIKSTNYNHNNPIREIKLDLTGDMERYAWSFNDKVLSEDSKIFIRKGEVVRFVMDNKTMMHHPIHLHGHFFRVLNGQGKYSPLKHTVNVPPMESLTIEFLANEEKDWFFHCHNLYHMKSGMTRVISYKESSQSTAETLNPLFSDLSWFYFFDIALQNNVSYGEFRAENTRNALNFEYEWDYEEDYEIEIVYERYINRFLELYAGWEFEQEKEDGDNHRSDVGIIGAHYLLPLMIEADFRLDTEGHGRFGLSSELQLTDRLSFDWDVNTDQEYQLQLEFELSKQFVVTGGRDDKYDWGVGLEFKF